MDYDEERQKHLPLRQYVRKSNALLRARWTPESILEPRLLAILASKIAKDDKDFKVYDIPVREILRENYSGRESDRLKTMATSMIRRYMEVTTNTGWKVFTIFQKFEYLENTGILQVKLSPDMAPHLLDLQEKFAKYNLLEYMLLPSVYSQRIYELLNSWKDKPYFVMSVDELHEMLGTPRTYRANFKAFRQKVLEKAEKDIKKHTELRYKWEVLWDGRKAGSIRFSFPARMFPESVLEKQDKAAAKAEADSKKTRESFVAARRCSLEHAAAGKCENDRPDRVCALCAEFYMLENATTNRSVAIDMGRDPEPTTKPARSRRKTGQGREPALDSTVAAAPSAAVVPVDQGKPPTAPPPEPPTAKPVRPAKPGQNRRTVKLRANITEKGNKLFTPADGHKIPTSIKLVEEQMTATPVEVDKVEMVAKPQQKG